MRRRRCTSYTATVKDKSVSFHALPKDGIMKEKWLRVIRAQRRENDWLATPYCKVCSKHFLASDIYVTEKNYRRLKKTAVPVITQEAQNINASPTSLQHVHLSEEDSIFETPRKAFLKKKN
ncbi:unnamed protein product [Arctia plantaginis]|uniref:THAP-type domain-containing protein n=1 Tax=Arctia plantaginis TaxID=874455 RepID=A0A8S1B650_ARCPL|nr:unnamed protein product [Arctia plantaginis]